MDRLPYSRRIHRDKGPAGRAPHGVSDQWLILDSAEKDEGRSDPGKGLYAFNIRPQGPTRDRAIGVRDTLDTVTEIQVMPFYVPLPKPLAYTTTTAASAALPFLVANATAPTAGDAVAFPLTQLPYGGRVVLQLHEVGIQSVSGARGRQFSFEFDATVQPGASGTAAAGGAAAGEGERLLLTPVAGLDKYIYTDPLTDLHGLTVSFFNPYEPVVFPPDVLYGCRAVDAAGAGAGGENVLAFNTPSGLAHNLAADDRIFISGLTVNDSAATPLADRVVDDYVNSVDGRLVGAAPTAAQFRLNPDVVVNQLSGSAYTAPVLSTTRVNVIVAKNRFRIPLRCRRIVDRRTNYIVPS